MDSTLLDVKSAGGGYHVKDLLDIQHSHLPVHHSQQHHLVNKVVMTAGAGTGHVVTGDVTAAEVTSQASSVPYYDHENPYTRWLHNNEAMQYTTGKFTKLSSRYETRRWNNASWFEVNQQPRDVEPMLN